MSDIIFLQPASSIPADVTALAQHCTSNLMSHLRCNFAESQLCGSEDNLVFTSTVANWLASPEPKVYTTDSNGIKTRRFEGTDYSINLTGGVITFNSAVTDTVTATFSAYPWNDSQVTEFAKAAISEIRVLVWRNVDENNIHSDYRPAICRRMYTKFLEDLLGESKDFYSVSVSGRNINKDTITQQINEVITQNETQLMQLVESLRHYNRTNRLLPCFTTFKIINSSAEVI